MKAEKVVLSFIAVLIGILVAAGAFYLYQATKTPATENPKTIVVAPTNPLSPKPTDATIPLTIDTPKDGEVVESKSIKITGKTVPTATIIVTTPIGDDILEPTTNGSFTTTQTLEDGVNVIEIRVILPTGETIVEKRTVTYSTENF